MSLTTTRRRGSLLRRTAAALAAGTVLGVLPAAVAASSAGARTTAPADAISPEAAKQIEAIEAEKQSRTPAEQKVDSNLLYAVNEAETGEAVPGAPHLESTTDVSSGRVEVDIDATVSGGLLRAIRAGGGSVAAAVPGFDAVRATVPLGQVEALAARPDVQGIRPADEATTNRASGGDASAASVGSGNNEADVTTAAATARTSYGVDGSGVKVCVLSDGVNSLAARQSSGDLPAVDVLSGQAGNGDEGTAMLELIHDIAPGASLGFATAFTSLASFAQNIVSLKDAGCKIIVDDVTYYSEPTFQDGSVAQAISTVRAAGVTYFTSAGNSGNQPDGTSGTWIGDFQDSNPSQSPLTLGLRVHGWGVGAYSNTITKTGGPLNLQWADPWGASTTDYDMYLLSSDGLSITASSTNVQNGSQNPAETIATSPSGGRVLVTKATGTPIRHLVLYTNRGQLTYNTGGGARGHNMSVDAISVAATPAATAFNASSPTGPYPSAHSTSDLTELFSSDGPVRQFFTAAGTAITPGNFTATGGAVRNAVDITAPDGVTTTTPGFIPFYGTSAAAPNAAAVAALALEAKPALTPLQVENALGATAIDIEAGGYDSVTGAGIINAPSLLANVGATPKARLAAASRSVTPQTGDGDSYLEPGETATITQLLTNNGSANATAISATLTSGSANATVTQGSVTYGNIAPGATGSPNTLPFRISVAAGCPCGTALPFTLTVTYSGGLNPTLTIPVTIPIGQPTGAVDHAYAGSALAIPDNSTTGASAVVNVPTSTTISSVTVTIGGSSCNATAGSTTVGIDHSYVEDLTLSLTSPTGTTVELMSGAGGGGNNLCQTVFSDAASSPISGATSANAPFTGSWKPAGTLAAFAGQNPQGNWTLKAVDSASGDTGTIRAFSIQISGFSCSGPNVAPTAVGDSYSTGQGVALNVTAPGVLGNDTDSNGDAITSQVKTSPSNGSVTLNPNGSFTYTPNAGFHGTDSFTYQASDTKALSSPATVSITVNGTPTAVADTYKVAKGGVLNSSAPGVLANDTDPEGNALTATKITDPSHGTLTLNANGSFLYTPTAGYAGPDSFTYKASDGTTQSAAQTASIVVDAPPVAVDDGYGVTAGTTANVTAAFGVLANDTDAEGDPLTAAKVTNPSHGTLAFNSDGSFSYTPTVGYTGADSFTYQAVDAWGTSNVATVTLTITADNVAPTANGESYLTARNAKLTVAAPGVLGNDTDPEGNALTATLVSGPATGTLVLDQNGGFQYTPLANTSGVVSFTYKAYDGNKYSGNATVQIRVNAPPSPQPDSYTADYQTTLTVPVGSGVLANDSDAEGDAMTAQVAFPPSHGTLTLNANGSFSYVPANGYSGGDAFTYKAKDAYGTSAAATVSLVVNGLSNDAPVAVADAYRVVTGHSLVRSAPGVLGNDTDADGDSLTASVLAPPSHGSLSISSDGSFTYAPASGYTGSDSFTYRANDGQLSSTPGTVTITVLTPTYAYVDAIYADFLTRAPDAAGESYWGGRLDRKVETRSSFVLKMSRSHEYSVKIVTRAFQDTLGRTPDPSGREYWAGKVQKGMPISTLVLNLIASNEYLTKSGGTTGGFVDATFKAILGRTPTSAERSARVSAIDAKKLTRLKMASDLYASSESRRRRVRYEYSDLLGRSPSTSELDDWVAKLATKSDVDLAIFLGASQEYYDAAQVL
ncbi:MAG: Ig-like domain-containing protein [Acidimicrobiales bacterium]